MSVHTSITCTPHFKSDAEKPWIIKETSTLIHYWFNPGKPHTLLEVAEAIEVWVVSEYAEDIKQAKAIYDSSCCIKANYTEPQATIYKMEIRGVSYDRETMAVKYTNECLHDEEPITVRAESRGGVTVTPCTIL